MKPTTLREARRRAKLTQEQLAAKSSVDQTTISSLETGRHSNPTLDTVERLAKALGIAPSRLRFTDPEQDSLRDGSDKVVHAGGSR
jgi:transcriptional regulator with XRE-family HTH domain